MNITNNIYKNINENNEISIQDMSSLCYRWVSLIQNDLQSDFLKIKDNNIVNFPKNNTELKELIKILDNIESVVLGFKDDIKSRTIK